MSVMVSKYTGHVNSLNNLYTYINMHRIRNLTYTNAKHVQFSKQYAFLFLQNFEQKPSLTKHNSYIYNFHKTWLTKFVI